VSREGEGEYSAHLFARKAVNIIEAHQPAASPLFLYLAFQNIHKEGKIREFQLHKKGDSLTRLKTTSSY
jgi:hypothetical protein